MIIQNQTQLNEFCAALAKGPYLAIDTEFKNNIGTLELISRALVIRVYLRTRDSPGHEFTLLHPVGVKRVVIVLENRLLGLNAHASQNKENTGSSFHVQAFNGKRD